MNRLLASPCLLTLPNLSSLQLELRFTALKLLVERQNFTFDVLLTEVQAVNHLATCLKPMALHTAKRGDFECD